MIRCNAYRRRRAAILRATLLLAAGVVLFTPKLEDFRLPDIGSFGSTPFIGAAQAGEGELPKAEDDQ